MQPCAYDPPVSLLLRFAFCVLRFAFCVLPSTFYLLPSTFYLLPFTCYLLPFTCYLLPSLANHVLRVLLVVTDVFDQLGIRHEIETRGDGPRLGIRLRIIDRDVDFQVSEITAPEAFRRVQRVSVRVAGIVQPWLVIEAG